MSILIIVIGIAITLFIVYTMVEVVWKQAPQGHLADALSGASTASRAGGMRGVLTPMEKPVGKYTPAAMLRKTQANLYWAQMMGKWIGWSAVQLIALRVVAAAGVFLAAAVVIGDPLLAAVAGYIGWNYPEMSVNGVARKARRRFVSQLPEFIQLVSAQMSANVSMEEAIQRTSRAPGLVGAWMQKVIQQAQGRDLIAQMQREAQESRMPELIGMSVQLAFIRRGTAQQDLMNQLAMGISSDYIGQADQRAEKLGSELVAPMVLFYFIPFLVVLLVVIGYPVMTNLFGGI